MSCLNSSLPNVFTLQLFLNIKVNIKIIFIQAVWGYFPDLCASFFCDSRKYFQMWLFFFLPDLGFSVLPEFYS